MRRICAAVGLAVAVLPGGAARADTTDTLVTVGYVVAVGFGGIGAAVNGTYLAYDEPAARSFRLLGLGAGGVDLALGAALLITTHDTTEGVVLGGLAVGIGAAALSTDLLVKEESVHLGVQPVAHGGLLTVAGRF